MLFNICLARQYENILKRIAYWWFINFVLGRIRTNGSPRPIWSTWTTGECSFDFMLFTQANDLLNTCFRNNAWLEKRDIINFERKFSVLTLFIIFFLNYFFIILIYILVVVHYYSKCYYVLAVDYFRGLKVPQERKAAWER